MRYNSKSKTSKVLPLRWSFGSKDRRKPATAPPQTGTDELVEYLESGRRPRCTKEPIVSIVASPSQVKAQLREDDALSSPGGSSEGVERISYQGPDSPRLPEGQSRPASDFNSIASNYGSRAGASLASSKLSRQDGTQVGKSLRGSPAGLPNGTSLSANGSSSACHSRDSTSKRVRSQAANRTQAGQAQVAAGKFEDGRCKDDGVSGSAHAAAQLHNGKVHGKTLPNKSSTKVSQSNGGLNGKAIEVRKTNHSQKSSSKPRENHVSGAQSDIKRAHSSSNIQSRLDMTLKRTLSLQRNGPLVPLHKGPAVEKSNYATLQRIRYSSTSLGRQRPVPESCF